MWQAYKYLYYRSYTWQRKMWGAFGNPQFKAVCLVTTMNFVNIMAIIFALQAITHLTFLIPEIPIIPVVIGIVISIINYFLLMRKGKYQQIVDEFKDESKKVRRKRTLWLTLYFMGSIGLFGFSFYLIIIFK